METPLNSMTSRAQCCGWRRPLCVRSNLRPTVNPRVDPKIPNAGCLCVGVWRTSNAEPKSRSGPNERYLAALAATSGATPLFEWVDKTCQPVYRQGRRYRALNPWSKQDGLLLQLVNRGEFTLNGFRNRDLCQ